VVVLAPLVFVLLELLPPLLLMLLMLLLELLLPLSLLLRDATCHPFSGRWSRAIKPAQLKLYSSWLPISNRMRIKNKEQKGQGKVFKK
jgi:hypothetical protein